MIYKHLTKIKYFALVATLALSANTQLTRIANHNAAANSAATPRTAVIDAANLLAWRTF